MRQGAHFLLPVKLVFNRKRSSATTSKIVILFFFPSSKSLIYVHCGIWAEIGIMNSDLGKRTETFANMAAFWRLSVCVMWPNNSADSRALFRAGRQLLQVGSHDIQAPRI